MLDDGKWAFNYNTDAERWDCDDLYDTKEEAINAAREGAPEYAEDYLGEGNDYLENGYFDVGQLRKASYAIDGDDIIEHIQEQFFEQCGDVSENWLGYPRSRKSYESNEDYVKRIKPLQEKYNANIDMLENRIHDVVDVWLKEIGEEPNFYSIENTQTIKIKK
jgi:hypothetical protein